MKRCSVESVPWKILYWFYFKKVSDGHYLSIKIAITRKDPTQLKWILLQIFSESARLENKLHHKKFVKPLKEVLLYLKTHLMRFFCKTDFCEKHLRGICNFFSNITYCSLLSEYFPSGFFSFSFYRISSKSLWDVEEKV